MKHSCSLIFGMICLSVCCATAADGPDYHTRSVSNNVDGLEITITMCSNHVERGEMIPVTLRFENVSRENVQLPKAYWFSTIRLPSKWETEASTRAVRINALAPQQHFEWLALIHTEPTSVTNGLPPGTSRDGPVLDASGTFAVNCFFKGLESRTKLGTIEVHVGQQGQCEPMRTEKKVVTLEFCADLFRVSNKALENDPEYRDGVCQRNIAVIDNAKEMQALKYRLTDGAIVNSKQISVFIGKASDLKLPKCLDGGVYKINPIGTLPQCSMGKEHDILLYDKDAEQPLSPRLQEKKSPTKKI